MEQVLHIHQASLSVKAVFKIHRSSSKEAVQVFKQSSSTSNKSKFKQAVSNAKVSEAAEFIKPEVIVSSKKSSSVKAHQVRLQAASNQVLQGVTAN